MNDFVMFWNEWGIWGWMSFGLILMILELIMPGTFIMWFGFGAILTGVLTGIFELAGNAQIATFVVCSIISVIGGFFVYKKLFGANKDVGTEEKVGAHKYIGETVKVAQAIQDGSGKVAVGDTVWLARSEKDIPKGRKVKVVAVKGTVLIVE